MSLKLIPDSAVTFGTESLSGETDLEKKPKTTDTESDADSDFDSGDDDGDDEDAAEEALIEDVAAESRADAFDFAVETLGGAQVSLLSTAARISSIDGSSSAGLVAVESLGSDTPELSIQMAIEEIEEQKKTAAVGFIKRTEIVLGRMINIIPDLIAKLPGGTAVTNMFAKTGDVFTGPTASLVMGTLGVASGLFQSVHATISAEATAKHIGALGPQEMGRMAKHMGMTYGPEDPFALVRKRGRELRKNLIIKRGAASELGWTQATWTKVTSTLNEIGTFAKKLVGDIGSGVKMLMTTPAAGEGKAINIMRSMRGIRALVSITNFLIYGVIAFVIIKLIRMTSKAARNADAKAASAA